MAKLILTLDNAILSEIPLNKARTTIGRRSVSDIHIDHLAVSGEHAAILQMAGDFHLEDLNSTNGTRINGEVVKNHLLQHNDVISIGKYQLKFLDEATSKIPVKTEATPALEINTDSPQLTEVEAATETATALLATPIATTSAHLSTVAGDASNSASTLAIAKIKLLNGSNAGRELTINKALTTLGKVGAQVAVINKRPHGYFITHIEGRVFPIVNGSSTGAQAFALNHNDIIELAGVKMEFHLSPSP